jgi:hypothetical protein
MVSKSRSFCRHPVSVSAHSNFILGVKPYFTLTLLSHNNPNRLNFPSSLWRYLIFLSSLTLCTEGSQLKTAVVDEAHGLHTLHLRRSVYNTAHSLTRHQTHGTAPSQGLFFSKKSSHVQGIQENQNQMVLGLQDNPVDP